MADVSWQSATCIYPKATRPAVSALDLRVEDGELLVLVGPSGCGKSTALRMLAGLEPVHRGTIRIGGKDVTAWAPGARDVAMVFQNYALYPHMSVRKNMSFALELAGVEKAERDERVREAAALLELEAFLDRKPKALSGGQRQRVAMGRAIVRRPQVFLMDEPLSNLDAKLRAQTRVELAALQARLGVTTVYVTHDQVEAMTMGHRIAVLSGGVLQQCDTPRTVYERPCNTFVATFLGSPQMNLHAVPLEGEFAVLAQTRVRLAQRVLSAAHRSGLGAIVLGLRPEALERVPHGEGLPLEVQAVEALGADAFVHGRVRTSAGSLAMIVRVDGRVAPAVGEVLRLRVHEAEAHAFHPETGKRLD